MKKYWFPITFLLITCLAIFLRFYDVTKFPPSLYWEEMAIGYDSYSVFKTGKDHLGNSPSIVAFESYGDYKPALYFYLLLPTIAAFGLTEFAIRLPAMIAGVLIVIGVGIISRRINRQRTNAKLYQLVAMGVTAICPWALQFSRAGWEVNVATCFIVWAVVAGLFIEKKQKLKTKILLSVATLFLFGLSMYTYQSTRVIAPFMALAMMLNWVVVEGIKIRHFVIGVLFVAMITPLILALRDPNTKVRLQETSLFGDGHVVLMSNHYQDLLHHSLLSRILYHRYVFYVKEYLANYLVHFSPDFLFVHGDQNLRHSVQYFGQLYYVDAIFLFLGVIFLFKYWKREHAYLLFWLLIAIAPAALTKATPHALRTLPSMPVFVMLISFGIMQFHAFAQKVLHRFTKHAAILTWIFVIIIYLCNFIPYWHFYSTDYPKMYYGGWQYGYRQITEEVNRRKDAFQHVFITREMDRPAMAYWFFSKSDPREVQKIDKATQQDQGPPINFGNISFVNSVANVTQGLVASSVVEMQQLKDAGRGIDEITYINNPAGRPIWAVYKLD